MTNTIKARWDDAFQAADKTQKLTSATRSALKSAIAEHGLWSDLRTLMLQGRNTGQLTKDELLTVAHILEIRVDGLSVDAADNTDAATLDDATLAHNTVETATDASYTPSLDAAMTVARDALDNLRPFMSDKVIGPLENAIAHVALAAKDDISNVVPIAPVPAGSLPQAKPVTREKAQSLFPIKSPSLCKRDVRVWDAVDAPRIDRAFVFQDDLLEDVLVALERSDTIWLAGPKGTGKTSLPREIAARTKRPCVRIAHHRTTEPVELIGSMYPASNGGVEWKDGVLTAAIRRAGTIIILDEPTFCRAGVLALYQTLLDHRFLTLAEHGGEVVPCAQGVTFVIADNTAGNGDATGRYSDTNNMNAAFLDRAAKILSVDYLPRGLEIQALMAKAGCDQNMAETIVDFAAKTRKAGEQGDITEGLSFRRMVAFAHDMLDGIDARRAFKNCIINHAPADDAVAINELAKAHLNFNKLTGKPAVSTGKAAGDFESVSL